MHDYIHIFKNGTSYYFRRSPNKSCGNDLVEVQPGGPLTRQTKPGVLTLGKQQTRFSLCSSCKASKEATDIHIYFFCHCLLSQAH